MKEDFPQNLLFLDFLFLNPESLGFRAKMTKAKKAQNTRHIAHNSK